MSTSLSQCLCPYSCCVLSYTLSSAFLPPTGTPTVSLPSSSLQCTSPPSPWRGEVSTLHGAPTEMGLGPPSSVPTGRVSSPVPGTWQSTWGESSWESGCSSGGEYAAGVLASIRFVTTATTSLALICLRNRLLEICTLYVFLPYVHCFCECVYFVLVRASLKELVPLLLHVVVLDAVLWVLTSCSDAYVEPISRRFANLSYILWMVSRPSASQCVYHTSGTLSLTSRS